MNPQAQGFWTQPTDKQALDLAHAIALAESGHEGKPNYQAVGDAGTSKGAYQWQPGNFAAAASEAGLDPSDFSPANQDKVAYYQVKKFKDQGLDPGQIASKWNSGSPDNWKDHSGTTIINGQAIRYDTPAYVKRVQEHYAQMLAASGGAPAPQGGIQPPGQPGATGSIPGFAPPQQPEPYQETQEAGMSQQDAEGGSGIKKVAGGIMDFLFPIAGDIKNVIEGDNQKTGLQLAGSAGLSLLPFIPGLGWGGKAVQGAALGAKAVEGAALAGKAAEGGGLLAKFLGSKAATGAAAGYGTGVAANLNEGQGLGESFAPNVNTIAGTAIGGAAPKLIEGVGALGKKLSGITPQIETELRGLGSLGDPSDVHLYNEYIDATKQHATNVRAKAPLTIAADELDHAANKITTLTKAAGMAVGEAKKAGANLTFHDNPQIFTGFDDQVAERFGLKLSPIEEAGAKGGIPTIDFDGTGGPATRFTVHPIAGSMREVEPGVATRVAKVAEQISKLEGASVKQASEIIHNLNELVDFSKVNQYGKVNDPLEGLIKKTAGEINEAIRASSPEIAQANDVFSALKGLQEEIGGMAGKNLQKGELLMRRVFSGDKSGDVNDLFQKIKDITGIDLIKHAVLAKHAITSVGSQADKTLLEQIIESGIQTKSGGLLGGLMGLGRSAAQSTFANPETIGRELVGGGKKGLLSDWLTTGAIEASRGAAPATGN